MKVLQLTNESIYTKIDYWTTEFLRNKIVQYCLIVYAGVYLLWLLFSHLTEPYPIISAEIVFRDNSKAELTGEFEVFPNGKFKHLETGAIFHKKDILYKKHVKKVVKKNI